MKTRPIHATLMALALSIAVGTGQPGEAAPPPLDAEQAAELKRLILPHPGENAFWQVDWLQDIWEARQQAAAEGKPIFVWSGSEGAPITNC